MQQLPAYCTVLSFSELSPPVSGDLLKEYRTIRYPVPGTGKSIALPFIIVNRLHRFLNIIMNFADFLFTLSTHSAGEILTGLPVLLQITVQPPGNYVNIIPLTSSVFLPKNDYF